MLQVKENSRVLQKSKIKRIDELIDNMIDKQRDSDGKFKLHEGFKRKCGLKGSKLSGG